MSTARVAATRFGAARETSASDPARKGIALALGIRKTHACVSELAAKATNSAGNFGGPQHAALDRDSTPGQISANFEKKVSAK